MSARLLGHPIHPMLIVFPLGLLGGAVIFDVITLVTHNGAWMGAGFYMIAAGIVAGLLAAVFGLVDWLGIPPNTRAKRIGLLHGLGNVVVVGLFAISWVMRRPAPMAPGRNALIPSFVALLLALVTGWLGGELVDRLGVGVDPGANVNAPSSLSGRPAA
jgi:uncharacterized membrane protein